MTILMVYLALTQLIWRAWHEDDNQGAERTCAAPACRQGGQDGGATWTFTRLGHPAGPGRLDRSGRRTGSAHLRGVGRCGCRSEHRTSGGEILGGQSGHGSRALGAPLMALKSLLCLWSMDR